MIWWRSPRHAPHIWTRQRQCVFDLPYACMCSKHPRGSKLSSSNVIRRGEVRWSHNVQFCLKSEVSLEHRGRSRSPVSCARKAADDEDLQLCYVVRSVAIEFSPNRQCRTGLSYSRVPTPARSVTDPGGGVLGPKNDGGVPLAAENWTQKDRGKNEIWGLKDRIL